MRLSEARVVLTGASGGIGLAIATALCDSGARVLAVARHRQPLEPLLERYPNNLCWIAADLTSLADRNEVLAEAESIGGINLFINAAGAHHIAPPDQPDATDHHARLHTNASWMTARSTRCSR